MSVLQWILSIILFILSLSVLIIIHELGHLSMAKLFNVYCQEFSIGFGPALLHKRKKGKETYFSIRAFPLGGYVAMYGEGMELEEGLTLPKERSIEGIKRYKKAIILVAGVTLNAVLALTLFAVSNLCFPLRQLSRNMRIEENSIAYKAGIIDNSRLSFVGPQSDPRVYFDSEDISGKKYSGSFYIIDDDVTYNENKYVLCWAPSTNSSEPIFSESFKLYPSDNTGSIAKTTVFKKWSEEYQVTLKNYPNITLSYLNPEAGISFDSNIKYFPYLGLDSEGVAKYDSEKTATVNIAAIKKSESSTDYKWQDIGIKSRLVDTWLPFDQRVSNTFTDFGEAAITVFKGIGTLFTQGIQNMSGIIGIFSQSATIFSNYTVNYYLYFWGLISVNLAIFNLLPFPGLDGWQLLVTAIEGGVNATKRKKHKLAKSEEPLVEWKIPNNVKNIVSYIGLALLLLLALAVVVIDIMRLVK